MSTYSNLKFELITTGDLSGTWGTTTNTNIGTAIEQAIAGMATLTSSDFTANVCTLTLTNTNALQNARAMCIVINAGAVSAAGTLNVPAIQKPYVIINNSSFAVTVKVAGLTGVAVAANKRTVVYNNGTDVGVQIDYLPTLTLGTPLAVSSGGTGAASFTVGALLMGAGVGAVASASAADIVAAIGSTAVANATNASTVTNGVYTIGDQTIGGVKTFSAALREHQTALAAANFDLALGNFFSKTLSGNTTFTVSNVPTTGTAASFILDLTNGGSATITWWSGVKWAYGTAPTLTAAGRDVLGFFTYDGGTTWSGLVLGKDMR